MKPETTNMANNLLQASDRLMASIKKALDSFNGGFRFAPWVRKRNAMAQDADVYPGRAFGEVALGNLAQYREKLVQGIAALNNGDPSSLGRVAKLYLSLSKQFDFDSEWMPYDDRKAFERCLSKTIEEAATIVDLERK